MRVRQVLGSGARRETYTLVDDDGRVVELVDDYLALCTDREHSPNTLRARAYDLKEWLTFLRLLDRGRGSRPGSAFFPLTAAHCRPGRGCRFSGPNSPMQKMTSGSPASGITSRSAMAYRCSTRAFFTA
jgi:hypothetical protein